MPTTLYSVTLDGVTGFQNVEGDAYSWGPGKYIQHAAFELGDGNDLDATFNLSGSDWSLEYFHTWSAASGILRVTDVTDGPGRFIRHMTLNDDSEVSLTTTEVDVIDATGDGANHDIKLGVAGARLVNAWGDVNRVETGSGFVGAIYTGGVGTVHVYGGSNVVNTSDQADEIGLFGGFTGVVEAGDGDDLFGTVGGNGGRVFLGEGNDRAFLLDGYVDLLSAAEGNDQVVANGGGAEHVGLGDGDDSFSARGESFVGTLRADAGTKTITVAENAGIGHLELNDSTATITVQGPDAGIQSIKFDDTDSTFVSDGFHEAIHSWRGSHDITVNGGVSSMTFDSDVAETLTIVVEGWVGAIQTGAFMQANIVVRGGVDTIMLDDRDDTVDVRGGSVEYISAGAGNDTVYGGDDVDTIRGGAGNDVIDGGGENDWLLGNRGDDWIRGGAGFDQATGGSGADTFVFFVGDGQLLIRDFEAGVDDLAIGGVGPGFTLTNLLPYVYQDGSDVVIGAGTQEVRFMNTQLSELSAGDVLIL